MKIKIEIECDTIQELHGHLNKIKEDVRKHTKKLKLDSLHDELPRKLGPELYDDNCYGGHHVNIR